MSRRVSVKLPDGRTAQAVEVPIEIANEKWSEFTLADGTTLRAKINVITIVRVEGAWDSEGGPIYQLQASPTLAFMNVPEDLKQPKAS